MSINYNTTTGEYFIDGIETRLVIASKANADISSIQKSNIKKTVGLGSGNNQLYAIEFVSNGTVHYVHGSITGTNSNLGHQKFLKYDCIIAMNADTLSLTTQNIYRDTTADFTLALTGKQLQFNTQLETSDVDYVCNFSCESKNGDVLFDQVFSTPTFPEIITWVGTAPTAQSTQYIALQMQFDATIESITQITSTAGATITNVSLVTTTLSNDTVQFDMLTGATATDDLGFDLVQGLFSATKTFNLVGLTVASFTPNAADPNIMGWWDFSTNSQDGGNGTLITGVTDKQTNTTTHDMISDVGKEPTRFDDGSTGSIGALFAGGQVMKANTWANFTQAIPAWTWICAVNITNTDSIFLSGTQAEFTWLWDSGTILYHGSGSGGGSQVSISNPTMPSGKYMVAFTIDNPTSVGYLRWNAGANSLTSNSAQYPVSGQGPSSIMRFGEWFNASHKTSGYLYEILYYDKALTLTEIDDHWDYLSAKWDL